MVREQDPEYAPLFPLSAQRLLFQLWSKLLRRRGSALHRVHEKIKDAHQKQRIYVHESIYDEFVPKFVDITKAYKVGDPTKPDTTLGPVVSLASAERIRKQVEDAGAFTEGWNRMVAHGLSVKSKQGRRN